MATTAINVSTSGSAQTLLAGATGKTIIVDGLAFIVSAASTVTFSGPVTGNLSGPMSFPANGGMKDPDVGFVLAAGESLQVTLGSSATMAGWVKWRYQ